MQAEFLGQGRGFFQILEIQDQQAMVDIVEIQDHRRQGKLGLGEAGRDLVILDIAVSDEADVFFIAGGALQGREKFAAENIRLLAAFGLQDGQFADGVDHPPGERQGDGSQNNIPAFQPKGTFHDLAILKAQRMLGKREMIPVVPCTCRKDMMPIVQDCAKVVNEQHTDLYAYMPLIHVYTYLYMCC